MGTGDHRLRGRLIDALLRAGCHPAGCPGRLCRKMGGAGSTERAQRGPQRAPVTNDEKGTRTCQQEPDSPQNG